MQVWLDVRRLAQVEPLNAAHPASIDMCSFYTTPQVLYVRLHSALSFDVAGGVGRLWLAALFAAGAHVERRVKALLFLDEFQRVVGEGVELLFQQARSCDIGLVLSTQSRASLKTRDYDFSDVVAKNVRATWAFDIADPAEQQAFSETSGKVIDQEYSYTADWSEFGWVKQSRTRRLVWADRIPLNEVKYASSQGHLSFLYVVRDGGFIGWHGWPEIVHTPFLQTKDEYERERTAPWPPPSDETILVSHAPPPGKTPPADGTGGDDEPPPVEVIGRPRPPKPHPQPRRRNQ